MAFNPMVISRINATKTTHLEQEKNILTLARWYREKYFHYKWFFIAMLIISALVWLTHLKLFRSKRRRNEEHTQAACGRTGGSRERVKALDIHSNLASPPHRDSSNVFDKHKNRQRSTEPQDST